MTLWYYRALFANLWKDILSKKSFQDVLAPMKITTLTTISVQLQLPSFSGGLTSHGPVSSCFLTLAPNQMSTLSSIFYELQQTWVGISYANSFIATFYDLGSAPMSRFRLPWSTSMAELILQMMPTNCLLICLNQVLSLGTPRFLGSCDVVSLVKHWICISSLKGLRFPQTRIRWRLLWLPVADLVFCG